MRTWRETWLVLPQGLPNQASKEASRPSRSIRVWTPGRPSLRMPSQKTWILSLVELRTTSHQPTTPPSTVRVWISMCSRWRIWRRSEIRLDLRTKTLPLTERTKATGTNSSFNLTIWKPSQGSRYSRKGQTPTPMAQTPGRARTTEWV